MARDEDDLPVLSSANRSLGEMSIEELDEYIGDLKTEIEKVEKVILSKKSAHSAANSVFGS